MTLHEPSAVPPTLTATAVVRTARFARPIMSGRRASWPSARRRSASRGEMLASTRNLTLDGQGGVRAPVRLRPRTPTPPECPQPQVGKIRQDLLGATPSGELAEHARDGDPQATNAGHAAHLGRIDRDPFELHRLVIRAPPTPSISTSSANFSSSVSDRSSSGWPPSLHWVAGSSPAANHQLTRALVFESAEPARGVGHPAEAR